MKLEIGRRFNQNTQRVETLLDIYDGRAPGTQGRRPVTDADLLRAAVVFLHATLEDLLRSIARWKLPKARGEVLQGIPLVGFTRRGKLAFTLGDLAGHRKKHVREVIEESVGEYLEIATYNNTDEVARLLESIRVDPARVNNRFGELQALMKRRHHIVHRADASETSGRGHHSARSLGRNQVRTWAEAVSEFGEAVLDEL